MRGIMVASTVLTLLLATIGCGSRATVHASGLPSTPPAATASPGAPGGSVGVVGKCAFYSDQFGGRAVITLVSVRCYAKQKDWQRDDPPKNGQFVVCDISVKATAGTFDVHPMYFVYQAPNGRTYDWQSGNAASSGYDDPELMIVTLNAGQHTRGYVVFDVPKGIAGADVQMRDNVWQETAVLQWNL